jgi:hypothetical protein
MEADNTWRPSEGDEAYLEYVIFEVPMCFALHVDFWGKRIIEMWERRRMVLEAQRLATDAINLKQPIAAKDKKLTPPEVIPL